MGLQIVLIDENAQLSHVLPRHVRCVEQYGTLHGDLYPEEVASLGHAIVEKRRKEFSAGRACAHRAMTLLNREAVPIPIGAHREPVWPAGLIGSITHCNGFCGAALALTSKITSVGIDAEPNSPLPTGVASLVLRKEEREQVNRHQSTTIAMDKIFFSAKESIYKAWYYLEQDWLDFNDVTITIDPDAQAFHCVILKPSKHFPCVVKGLYRATQQFIFTGLTVTKSV